MGVGFNSDIDGDGVGDTKSPVGGVILTPDKTTTYSVVCNDPINTGGSVEVIVTKRPFFIEN